MVNTKQPLTKNLKNTYITPKGLSDAKAELEFLKDGFYLEVVTKLYQYERFKGILWNSPDDVWQETQLINFEVQAVRILSHQNQLLHLCHHLSMTDLFNGTIHFLDVKEILEHSKDSLNWNALLEKAKKQHLCNCLYYTLLFIEKFFNINLPHEIYGQLKPNWLKKILLKMFINKLCLRPF